MFWISLIPALLLLVQQVVGLFGVSLQTEALGQKLVDLVGAVFAVLALMGVVTDPTTPGLRDGEKLSGNSEEKYEHCQLLSDKKPLL